MNILIVDDETLVREELRYILETIDEEHVIAEAGNVDELFQQMEDLMPDVVFLDIELPGKSGLVAARKLMEEYESLAVILSTAYDKYAVVGFELNVTDYILKPFSIERTRKALERAMDAKQSIDLSEIPDSVKHRLCVYKNDRMYLMDLKDIYYLESESRQIQCLTKEGMYQIRGSLKEVADKLTGKGFIRISKSTIVNVDSILELQPWFNYTMKLILNDGENTELVVNRGYLKDFKKTLGI